MRDQHNVCPPGMHVDNLLGLRHTGPEHELVSTGNCVCPVCTAAAQSSCRHHYHCRYPTLAQVPVLLPCPPMSRPQMQLKGRSAYQLLLALPGPAGRDPACPSEAAVPRVGRMVPNMLASKPPPPCSSP